ncbi:myrcene synthase, chloroplastic-like [Carya illinoinensis]|uniref:Uncharacterized protein n=1 Tax=Carya illinoinensis TaxID=32201 RepID=A0A8T1QLI6_CARIL|nr:myrcene synthase, chloroplastic-like [Carya illinoinensis]KAG6655720.1 hypothetical protein CIPAW_05G235300 [Carya illinoinensis]KAG6714991.1 hypothetical protein I3842_05G228200 [Carya illinoinensis]
MALEENSSDSTIVRRSGNYHPTIWHDDYIQSLKSEYVGESYTRKLDNLKEEVTKMFHKMVDPLKKVEMIDILQRLGVSYHFEDEIQRMLDKIHSTHYEGGVCKEQSLYATALEFRLLREKRYNVPQETFKSFTNENGNFKECLCDDPKGMLALYEASFLLIEGESILEEARDFASKHLKDYVEKSEDQNLCAMVNHALELPLYWRMIRLEVRWFIDVYRRREDMNPILLQLAELDFNVVQAVHQEDLKEASRWWRSTGLGELSFVRDRVMENFLWTIGASFQPQFGYFRKMSTRLYALITTIDDVYDVYGTLDELELFTDVVERWDVNAMEQLPYYMQLCFLTLYNSINEMAFDALKEHGLNTIQYLKKGWADLCRSYLLEAKWYYNRYTPSLQEYFENAWITISEPLILLHSYIFVTNPIKKEALDLLKDYPNITRWQAIIVRLADDLGTSKEELERGDNPKSIQCYMNDTGASEEDAREFIRNLISATWKRFNEELAASSPFSETLIHIGMNFARMSQCIYQHGDGHGIENRETKDRVLALLIHPIPLPKD